MNSLNRTLRLIFLSAAGKLIPILFFVILIYTFWTTFLTYDSHQEALISSVLLLGLSAILLAVAMHIRNRENLDPEVRRAWLFLGLGFLSNLIAECIWLYYESILRTEPALFADFFYILFYPLVLMGILSLPVTGDGRHSRIILFLDLAIVMCTGFMALWYFVLTPTRLGSLEQIENMIVISYPLAGSFILGAIVTLTHRDLTKITWRVLFFLGLGMFLFLIADSILAYKVVNQIPYDMTPLNSLWLFGLLFMLVAAALQTVSATLVAEDPVVWGRSRRFIQQSLPYLSTVIGVALLVISIQSRTFSSLRLQGVLIGMIVLVGLVLIRQDRLLQENMKLYEEMQRIALTDSLTGIHNRFFAIEALRTEIQRAKRYSHPLSILMIDLDHFKNYNDRFGHLEGDRALRQIAQSLMTIVRSSDVLGRYGGDEFIAILTMTNLSGAQVVAQKMKKIVKETPLHGELLGASVGIASFKGEMSVEELIDRADQDLYLRKNER